MAKKKPIVEDDPATDVDESAVEEPVYDPETHVCLDGGYAEHPEAASKSRTLSVGGQNYEHTHEDAAGVWCYRSM